MKKGRDMPMLIAPVINKNPYPYPNAMPAVHMQGEDGNRKLGNKEIHVKSTIASTGLLNVASSHSMIGITT